MKALEHNLNLPDAERIKTHFRENQKFYKGVGLGALLVLAFHHRPVQIINTVAPVFHNNNSSKVLMGGTLSKVIRNNTTGEIWKSITATAEAAGVPLSVMSKHLNGYPGYEDIKGLTYSIIGVGN